MCNLDQVNTVIIASYVVSVANGGADVSKLLKWTEETGSRLVLHVEWVVRVKQCMGDVIFPTVQTNLRCYC